MRDNDSAHVFGPDTHLAQNDLLVAIMMMMMLSGRGLPVQETL